MLHPMTTSKKTGNDLEQAPPATIAAQQESATRAPSPPASVAVLGSSMSPAGAAAAAAAAAPPSQTIPPRPIPIPPDDEARPAENVGSDNSTPSQQLEEEETGRSQRDSSSGTGDSGSATGAAAATYGAAQSSMPRNFRISLDGYTLRTDGDGKYAAYRISVTAGLHTWLVLRRCVVAPCACCGQVDCFYVVVVVVAVIPTHGLDLNVHGLLQCYVGSNVPSFKRNKPTEDSGALSLIRPSLMGGLVSPFTLPKPIDVPQSPANPVCYFSLLLS